MVLYLGVVMVKIPCFWCGFIRFVMVIRILESAVLFGIPEIKFLLVIVMRFLENEVTCKGYVVQNIIGGLFKLRCKKAVEMRQMCLGVYT